MGARPRALWRESLWALLLLATVLLGLYPLRVRLGCWPLTMDGTLWVARGALYNPDWWRWDFLSNHFIGYRPVAAVSFTLDYLVGGLDPLAYRLTDLGLHALTALLIYRLALALLGPEARWAGWLAMLVFLGHPAVEEAVPLLARRSYTLAATFGAASVLAFVAACRSQRTWSRAGWLATVLLVCAIFSNEEGYVLPAFFLVLALYLRPQRTGSLKHRLAPAALPWLGTVFAFLTRLIATQEVGGYSHSFPKPERFLGTSKRALEYLFTPRSGVDEPGVVIAGSVGVALVAAYLLWAGVLRPAWLARRQRGQHLEAAPEVLPLVLSIWLLGYVLLSLLTGAWYTRQAYPALAPLVLLIGALFHLAASAHTGRPWWLIPHLLPLTVLLAAIAYHSPMIHGLAESRTRAALTQQERLETAYRDLAQLPEPALVYLATPSGSATRKAGAGVAHLWYQGQRTSSWLSVLLRERRIVIKDIAFLTPASGETEDLDAWFDTMEGRPVLRMERRTSIGLPRGRFKPKLGLGKDAGRWLWLDTLPTRPTKKHFLYYFNGMEGRLEPLDVSAWAASAAEAGEQDAIEAQDEDEVLLEGGEEE